MKQKLRDPSRNSRVTLMTIKVTPEIGSVAIEEEYKQVSNTEQVQVKTL